MFLFHLTCLHYHQQCEKNWSTSVYKNWKSVYPWQVFGIIKLKEILFISKANNGPFWSHSLVPLRLFLIVCLLVLLVVHLSFQVDYTFWSAASPLWCHGPRFSVLVLYTCSRKHQCLSFVFPIPFSPLESVFLSFQYWSLHEEYSIWVKIF